MGKMEKVEQPRKNFVKITGRLLYTEEQLQTFQKELDARPIKEDNYGWWLGHQIETGVLSSFTIYAPKNVSQEDIIKEAFDKCDKARKEEAKFKLQVQSKEAMWFEDLPYVEQQKFGVCYKTTLSYLPIGIKCWKRCGRRSWDMLVPKDFSLDRGRRVRERDEYFENWQIAKDTFFGNESEALKQRHELIAKEKEDIRLASEKVSAAIRQAHQEEVDTYNEKYRLYRGETKEEYYKHPLLGEAYINSYVPPMPYTEERWRNTMRFIDEQIQEKKEKDEAEARCKMWKARISAELEEKKKDSEKSLVERASDLGYYFSYRTDVVDICQSCYCRKTIKYSEETVFLINQFMVQKEQELKKQQEEERLSQEYESNRAKARTMGLPADIRVWHRVGGSTNCGEGWVIKPDGNFREPTKFEAKKYMSHDGYKIWEQIFPGEVVLSWEKGCSAAEHEFKVICMPKDGLTGAQKEAILKIEEDIQEKWKDKRGLASGVPSPDVGMGWNICGRKLPLHKKEELVSVKTYEKNVPQESERTVIDNEPDRPIEESDLAKLLGVFGQSR